jgi:hypothetical protein
MRTLKRKLADPFAQITEAWWRDLSGEDIFSKTYSVDPAATMAKKGQTVSVEVLLDGDDEEEAQASEGQVPRLNIQVQDLHDHKYRFQAPPYTCVKMSTLSIKIGVTGTAITTTGGAQKQLSIPTNNKDERYVTLTNVLNDAIRRTNKDLTVRLPFGPLSVPTTEVLNKTLLQLCTGEYKEKAALSDAPVGSSSSASKEHVYTLDISAYAPVSANEGTRYSMHALSPGEVPSPPVLWPTSASEAKLDLKNRTLTLKFSGCLISSATSGSSQIKHEVPVKSLLDVAASRAAEELNHRIPSSVTALEWVPHPGMRLLIKETLLAGMGSHIYRAARQNELRSVDESSAVIEARSDTKLNFKNNIKLLVHMTPTKRIATSNTNESDVAAARQRVRHLLFEA